jgi:hypothetical protein
VVRRLRCCALLLGLLCAAAEASAQQGDTYRQLGAELTAGRLDEDYLLTLNPKFFLSMGGLWSPGCADGDARCAATLRLGMHAPLRLRVDDNAPVEGDTLRMEDWDEPGDYLRILRFVAYGDPGQPLSFRFGELGPLTVGGGTVIYNHFNTISPDNHRPGARLSLGDSTVYGDVFIDDVTRPALIGGELSVRPLGFLAEGGAAPTPLVVGLTVITDLSAPLELERGADGEAVVDATRRPEVSREQATTWIGGRVGYERTFEAQGLTLGASLDGNAHLDVGQGAHLGLHYAQDVGARVVGDAELILGSGGYLPRAIGPSYAVDRYQLGGYGLALPAPRLRVAATRRERDAGELLRAVYARLGVEVPGSLMVELAYQGMIDVPGADMALLRLSAPAAGALRASAFIGASGADASELLSPRATLIAAEARYDLLPALYIVGRYGQSWRLSDAGDYATVPDWSVGVGAAW